MNFIFIYRQRKQPQKNAPVIDCIQQQRNDGQAAGSYEETDAATKHCPEPSNCTAQKQVVENALYHSY